MRSKRGRKKTNEAHEWVKSIAKGSTAAQATKAAKAATKALGGKLDVRKLQEMLPATPGCYAHSDPTADRLRVFYQTPSVVRSTMSCSLKIYGEDESCRRLLFWAWERHT
eukprot:9091588-Lingulodinium_polyedra.AAC.1